MGGKETMEIAWGEPAWTDRKPWEIDGNSSGRASLEGASMQRGRTETVKRISSGRASLGGREHAVWTDRAIGNR